MNLLNINNKAYEILKDYNGTNPYIISLKNGVYAYQNKTLNKFESDYIIRNHKTEPFLLNKMIKIAKWFGESMQKKYEIDFTPEKLKIGYFLGETKDFYHMFAQYRRSQSNMIQIFIPKSAVLTALFVENFEEKVIDFEKYNKKSGLTLKPHQESSVKFLTTRKKGILALNMGLGKTIAAIVAALEDEYNKILVICPASLKTNWQNEIAMFDNKDEISIVEGKKWDEKRWTIINYDILDNFYTIPTEIKKVKTKYIKENGEVGWRYEEKEVKSKNAKVISDVLKESQLFQASYDLIIIDECHRLSNKTSGRYKIVEDLLEKSNPNGLYMLTGTIMSNNPTNYYNILKLLNADVTKDWVYYVKTYCSAKQIYIKTERDKVSNAYIRKKGKKTWYDLDYAERMELNDILDKSCRKIWIMGEPSNLDELQERTKHLYYRIVNDSSEIKKIVQMIDYNLDSFEQKVYDDAWDSYVEKQIAEGKSTKIDTKQLIETSLLRQVTAQLMIPHTSVIVKQYIANGDKVIIFCNFDKEVQAFKEEFGDLAVIYNGKMSIKEKDASVKRFMEDDDCMVFIGNIEAAGVGLTLIKSHVIVFNSVSWVPASNNQAEYRILRIGQTEDCVIIYQKFNNTYHDRIFEILDIKNKTIDAVIVSEDEK